MAALAEPVCAILNAAIDVPVMNLADSNAVPYRPRGRA